MPHYYSKKLSLLLGTLGVALALQPLAAFAGELSILDCDGMPRAVRNVEDNSKSVVQVQAQDSAGLPVRDVEFTLLRANNTGLKVVSMTKDGKASFSEIAPGAWKLCPTSSNDATNSGVVVSQVSILAASEDSNVTTAALIGGGALAVGGAVLGIVGSGSGGGSENDSATLTGSGAEAAPASPQSSGSNTPARRPSGNKPSSQAAAGDCLNDDTPDPLSPIS